MFTKLGLQLYTIRDYMKDAESADLAFEKMAACGYTEAHTAGFTPFGDENLGVLLQKHGISIIGTHYDYNEIVNNHEKTAALHRLWGTTNIGVGGMPGEFRNDAEGVREFIRSYNKAAEQYAKEGFRLTYHNHAFEFVRIDGYKTIMDLLYEDLDPATTSFVLDTCWVAAGGGDVTGWMEKLEGRLDILHLKDLWLRPTDGKNLPTMTEVGYGNLCWDKIMKTAEQIGVKHYVVEQDANFTGTAFDSIKMSADFLAKYKK